MANLGPDLLARIARIAIKDLNRLVDLWVRADGNLNKLASWARLIWNLPNMDAARELLSRATSNAESWLTRFKVNPDAVIPWSQIPVDPQLPWYRHYGSDFVYRVALERDGDWTTVWVRSKSELTYNQLSNRVYANFQESVGNSPRLAKLIGSQGFEGWEIMEVTPSRRQ